VKLHHNRISCRFVDSDIQLPGRPNSGTE